MVHILNDLKNYSDTKVTVKNQWFLLIFLLIISLSAHSCSEEDDQCLPSEFPTVEGAIPVENCLETTPSLCESDGSKINIRIRNFSRYDICNLEYNAYDENFVYGNIESGGCTCYIGHNMAFRYPVSMDYSDFQRTSGLRAIDFVGEAPLEKGHYNYNFWVMKGREKEHFSGYMIESDVDPDYYEAVSNRCDDLEATGCDMEPDMVNLRIVNESIFQLCSFTYLNPERNKLEFGNIDSGESTCYIPIKYIDKNNFRIEFNIAGFEFGQGLEAGVWRDIFEEGNYTLYVTVGSLNGESIYRFYEKDE